MSTFKLKVIASNKIFFDGDCKQVVIPVADDGLCGFLANHENCVAPIEFGEMVITKPDDTKIEAFIGSGFLEFFDNEASIVCISAEMPEEIDRRRAEEARERAQEELRQQHSVYEHRQFELDMARAMERLKVKNRHQI